MKRLLSLILCVALIFSAVGSLADVLNIDLSTATDEELAQAAAQIKAEQKARLKAHIVFDPAELVVKKGASLKVAASAADLDDGVTAGKFTWSTADAAIATCSNGSVKGVAAGTTTVICSTVLSDGTELSGEIPVTVVVPVQQITLASNKMDIMAGEVFVPELTIKPEDATNKAVTYASSDDGVVRVDESGQLLAVAIGKATVTVTAADGSGKSAKLNVNVTRKVGKFDDELTFQSLEWGSDFETCYKKLQEAGLVDPEGNGWFSSTNYIHFWPENDLFFAASSSKWTELPVIFRDHNMGAGETYLSLQKKIGGYEPQTAELVFLNGLNADGTVNKEETHLIGVYFYFDNKHEPGAEIFTSLLAKMEAQYGEFTKYIHQALSQRSSYKDIYDGIKATMEGAKKFGYRDFRKVDPDLWLYIYAIATLRGKNNTGIALMVDGSGYVTLFYGKTDALEQIATIQAALEAIPSDKEDAGI